MSLRRLRNVVLGALLAIALVGLPACSSSGRSQAFSGVSAKKLHQHSGFPGKSNYRP